MLISNGVDRHFPCLSREHIGFPNKRLCVKEEEGEGRGDHRERCIVLHS